MSPTAEVVGHPAGSSRRFGDFYAFSISRLNNTVIRYGSCDLHG
jgi:hypothetical protein